MHTQIRITKIILSLVLTLGMVLPFHSSAYAGQTSAGDLSNQACDTLYPSPHQRIGYNVTRELNKTISDYDVERLGAGWYLDYATQVNPVRPNGMDYAQMIRASDPAPTPAQLDTRVGAVIDANPGALWILGNEPDRQGQQDSIAPTEYVIFYHDVYEYIKARDPSSQIAIAGVIQPTPVRLLYLSTVLSEYERLYGEEMPIDVWTTHAFILREQRPPPVGEDQDVPGNWGAGMPTGITGSDELGRLYEVEQHGDLQIFKEQLIAMRQWMADNGQRDKELLVTEYGILFPEEFAGFLPEETRDFMLGTFDFMLEATDEQTGHPADGNRLIQRFSWFSLNSPGQLHPQNTGNFFDHSLFDNETFEIEFMGLAFEEYVATRIVTQTVVANEIDLAIDNVQFAQSTVYEPFDGTSSAPPVRTTTVTATIDLKNIGGVDAQNVSVRLWDVEDGAAAALLGTAPTIAAVAPSCTGATTVTIVWTVNGAVKRNVSFQIDVVADNQTLEADASNNQYRVRYYVGELENSQYLPMMVQQRNGPSN